MASIMLPFIETGLGRASVMLALCLLLLVGGCKLVIEVPAGAALVTESGRLYCPGGSTCIIEITDDTFEETFSITTEPGYYFAGWSRDPLHLCQGSGEPCSLSTVGWGENQGLMDFLQEDHSFYLTPVIVPNLEYDFSAVTERMNQFVIQSSFPGASVIVVDQHRGVVYEQAFGTYNLDTVVKLASVSKLPAATLLVTMAGKKRFDFDITEPISTYLPFAGVYGSATVEHLLSNTSGIPGVNYALDYGPHQCQFWPAGLSFKACGQQIYQHRLANSNSPGFSYSYGGSQWQLAGLVAEFVGNRSWGDLFARFIARPCDLEVMEYGNMLAPPFDQQWNGDPVSLLGRDKPNIEAGAISNLQDLGKILLLHLNDGWCGSRRVLNADAVASMQVDRKQSLVFPPEDPFDGYGLAWWIKLRSGAHAPEVHWIPGGGGSHLWLEEDLGYGAALMVDEPGADLNHVWSLFHGELIDLVRDGINSGRQE